MLAFAAFGKGPARFSRPAQGVAWLSSAAYTVSQAKGTPILP